MNELTREQILSMPAGRELDSLVAQHVMGWEVIGAKLNKDGYIAYSVDFKPSSDIAAAWKVVKKMHERGYRIVLYGLEEGYEVYFESETEEFFHAPGNESESISKAALLAVMGL